MDLILNRLDCFTAFNLNDLSWLGVSLIFFKGYEMLLRENEPSS